MKNQFTSGMNLKLNFLLNINFNCLEGLPESIGKLIELRSLGLRANELLSIPKSLGELVLLEELDMGGNKLRFWKDHDINSFLLSLGSLANLRSFQLDINPYQ